MPAISLEQLVAQGLSNSSAVTIGNYDGFHLGHQALLTELRRLAQKHAAVATTLSFDPHPAQFFRPQEPFARLLSAAQRQRGFLELGVEQPVTLKFDATISKLSAEEFFEKVLRQALRAKAIVVGHDFCFGAGRHGDVKLLGDLCAPHDIELMVIGSQRDTNGQLSSTRVRRLLQNDGDVATAAQLLGRPFLLEGVIAPGQQLGRKIGFPTLNLRMLDQMTPRYGVYAGHVWMAPANEPELAPTIMRLPSAARTAVFNIGVRPTVNETERKTHIEAHILDWPASFEPPANRRVGFYLVQRLRDEMKFAGLEELKTQIANDVVSAREIFADEVPR